MTPAAPEGQAGVDQRLALYEALVDLGEPSRLGLEELGFPGSLLTVELPRLVSSGMIAVQDDGTIAVTDPRVAIPAYAAELERAAADSRSGLSVLAERYRRARDEREAVARFDVTVTTGVVELDQTRSQVLRAARSTLDIVLARTPANDELLLGGPRETPLTRASLRRRVVLDDSILDLPGASASLDRLAETGAEVRLLPELALSVLVVDRGIAIVDITNHDPSGYGSIVVRHPPLVAALGQLADASFASATAPPRPAQSARDRFGARPAQALTLLAAGATDSTIARQIGVSQRTVERFVRAIMDDLGASTRFQAGVLAERQGLL